MIEWAEFGKEILARLDIKLSREERNILVAQVRTAELIGQSLSRSKQETVDQAAKVGAAPKRDLRQETLDLLAGNTFREPTVEEKEKFGTMGYDIFLPTKAKTLHAVVEENQDYFWSDELDYVNTRPNLRDYVPPTLTVALRSKDLFLSNSFGKSQTIQLERHEAESQDLQKVLPDARNIMLPASVDAQLDLAYFKETGQVLFRDRFVRALDETSDVSVAHVGRARPASRLDVPGWRRGRGGGGVGALSAAVMINRQ